MDVSYGSDFAKLQIARWNSIVPQRYILVTSKETTTHMVFMHPTKGYRRINKKRLGF